MTNQLTFIHTFEDTLPLRDDGHYHLSIPAFFEYDSYANHDIDFVFDTGAFLTVITRKTAAIFGFLDSYTIQHDIPLSGFAGKRLADLKELPGFVIGGRFLTGVKAAVPHDDTDMDILGLNVIDYFKYHIDTESDKIYFASNPQPEVFDYLRCKSVNAVSPDLRIR
ncbi:MAG: retroviral-like aspartic protease family protein [Oscillospiraceae bacterium]|nr:retroviral-like aspartic protease family protein [Oscillospiraceae bacterium]